MRETIEVQIKALVAGLREVQKLQAEIKGVERLAGKKLSVNVTGGERALNLFRQLSSSGDGLIDRLQGIEKASGASFGGMAAGAGVAVGTVLAVGGAIKFLLDQINAAVEANVELGSRFNDTSIATGLAVETLSGLENQLRQSNSSVEDLSDGVFFLQKNLGAAAAGNKQLRQTFAQMGITDFDAALSDMDGTLRKVLKSLAAIEDEGKRNVVGAEVMGRAYKQLRVFVEDLGGEVDETVEASRRLNLVMSGEAAAAADRLGDHMDLLRLRLERTRAELGGRFLQTTQNTLALIETLLDENNAEWDRWADGIGKSALRAARNLSGAVRLFTLGVPQDRIDAAERADTAAAITQSAKGGLGTKGDGDFNLGGTGGGGGGGKHKRPDIDTFDSELSLHKAQLDQSLNLVKDSLERENKIVEEQLRDRLTSIKQFYEDVRRIRTLALDEEERKLGLDKAAEKRRFDHAEKKIKADSELSDAERLKKIEIERNKSAEVYARINARLVEVSRERSDLADKIKRDEQAANEEFQKQLSEITSTLREAQGRSADAEAARIGGRFKDVLTKALANSGEELTAPVQDVIAEIDRLGGVTGARFKEILGDVGLQFDGMSDEVKSIIELIDLLVRRARIAESITRADQIFEARDQRVSEIESQRQGNYIAELRVRQQINEENKKYIDLLEDIIRGLEIRNQQEKDPELLNAIRRRRLELERMKQAQESFGQTLKDTAINSTVDGLTNLFVSIGTDATNAKEYVRDFAVTFIQEINRIIIRMLVLKAVMAALKIFGVGGGDAFGSPEELFAAGGVPGFAEGGMQPATPGGRIIQVAEGGYDEVVLTTDPKHRSRTERLLARFLNMTGIAPAFERGGFALNERLLNSVAPRIPALAAGDFISNLPAPRPARRDSGAGRPLVQVSIKPDAQGRVRSRSQIMVDYLRTAEEGRRNT